MSATKVQQTPSQRVPPTPGKSIGRLFAKPDFDPSAFCLNVLKNGREEVDDVARAAQNEMGQAEMQLHDAVYASEGLSVTASRQLRSAQADVCFLSSRLSEQRSEIGKLMAAPLFSSEATGKENNLRRDSAGDYSNAVTSGGGGLLAEKVEGCGFLGDAPGRGLLFDGQLTEVDGNRRIHMYLLTDCIVTAVVPPHHPRVVVRNKFDRLFPLDQVAVTAAPPPAPSTRLRLLSFPESRLFDTDNAGVRTAWLHQIDIAKKSRSRARSQQDASVSSKSSPPKQQQEGEIGMIIQQNEGTSLRPPDALQEELDELDVFVAERDLEAAVDSLLAIRKEWKQNSAGEQQQQQQQQDGIFSDSQTTAAKNRLRQRQNELVFLLFRELDTSVTHGAFLDARLAVTLLCRIDKAAEATHRLLGHGNTILRSRVLQQANFGGSSSSAVTLSRQLAENMANTGFATIAEFVEVIRGALGSCGFGSSAPSVEQESNIRIVNAAVLASCTASLTAWVGSQANWLTVQVYNQITNDQQQQGPNLQTLADCADILRRAVNSQAVFAGVGLELWPLVELFLAPFTTAAVKQAQAVLIESIKKHLVLPSSHASTPGSQKQHSSSPITALPNSLVTKIGQDALAKHFQNCPIAPPGRVVQFSDAILNFSTQLCSLYSTMQHTSLCRAVTSVLRAAAEQLAANKSPDRTNDDIVASFRFLFGPVLDRVMLQFRKISKLETRDFVQLQKECYGGNPPASSVPSSPSHAQTSTPRSGSPKTTKTPDSGSPARRHRSEQTSSPVPSSLAKSPQYRPPTPKRNPDEFV